jgi:hypothetical protein
MAAGAAGRYEHERRALFLTLPRKGRVGLLNAIRGGVITHEVSYNPPFRGR